MDWRHTKALLCVAAFLAVFAHSVIPHEHHCTEGASHIHHFSNCESIGTFIVKDTGLSPDSDELFPETGDVRDNICEYVFRPAATPLRLDSSDHFKDHGSSDVQPASLRGPPAV